MPVSVMLVGMMLMQQWCVMCLDFPMQVRKTSVCAVVEKFSTFTRRVCSTHCGTLPFILVRICMGHEYAYAW